jgi:hypothetical protein
LLLWSLPVDFLLILSFIFHFVNFLFSVMTSVAIYTPANHFSALSALNVWSLHQNGLADLIMFPWCMIICIQWSIWNFFFFFERRTPFWDVKPCNSVELTDVSKGRTGYSFRIEKYSIQITSKNLTPKQIHYFLPSEEYGASVFLQNAVSN